jgi:aspartate 1-decarboxylase
VVFVDESNRVLDRGVDPARVPDAAPATSLLRPGTDARAAAPQEPRRAAGPAMTTVGGWGAEPRRDREPRDTRSAAETTDARRLDALLSADR